MFDVVIINDDLERAYEELKEILDEVSEAASRLTRGYVNEHVTLIIPRVQSFFLSSYSGNQKSSGGQIIRGQPGLFGGCREEPTFVSCTCTKRPSAGPFGGLLQFVRANLGHMCSQIRRCEVCVRLRISQ